MINKPELLDNLQRHLIQHRNEDIPLADLEDALDHLIDCLTLSLKKRSRIEIREFGIFETKFRPHRKALNPKSKKVINLSDRYNPSFKPSKILNKKISASLQ